MRDHRTDDKSDKGAFIRFGDWSKSRPVEYKFLNLFPAFKEGMVHKIIDGTRKEVKDELQMYVTEARFMLSRPATSVNLKNYATLPFIKKIDPSITHEVIKPSDVSTLKDEKGDIASISTYDVYQSNGVIQVIDRVLLPKM